MQFIIIYNEKNLPNKKAYANNLRNVAAKTIFVKNHS